MVAKNEHTGDKIQSKIPSKEYGDNYDKIFRKDNTPPWDDDFTVISSERPPKGTTRKK